jgi:hypothetical protein
MTLSRILPLLLFVGLGALAGCSRQAPVKALATPGTDFSRYRTYAIKPGNVVYPGAPEEERRDVVQRVQDAVATELEGRGMEPQPDNPDLIVTYTVGANQREVDVGAKRAPVGVDVREGGGNPYDEPGLVQARELPDAATDDELRRYNVEADLLIDLLDGKSRKLVWRATSVVDLAPARRSRSINQVVRKAFAGLPLGIVGRGLTTTTRPTTTPAPVER